MMPKAISVNIKFDKNLEKIIGSSGYEITMSEGSNFGFLLQSIFFDYPEIEKKYPPGELGFLINDTPPKTYTPIFDDDVIAFFVKFD